MFFSTAFVFFGSINSFLPLPGSKPADVHIPGKHSVRLFQHGDDRSLHNAIQQHRL